MSAFPEDIDYSPIYQGFASRVKKINLCDLLRLFLCQLDLYFSDLGARRGKLALLACESLLVSDSRSVYSFLVPF